MIVLNQFEGKEIKKNTKRESVYSINENLFLYWDDDIKKGSKIGLHESNWKTIQK